MSVWIPAGVAGLVLLVIGVVFVVGWRSFTPPREVSSAPPAPTPHLRESVTLVSCGRRLTGWLTLPASPVGVVLLIHGWGSHAQPLLEWAEFLAEGGWASLVYDLRGHGGSEGSGAMTLPDLARDVLEGGAYLDRDPRVATLPRAVLGHSMGGAAVLLALERGLRAEAVILTSAFARVETLAARVLRKRRLPPALLGWIVAWVWRLRAGDLEAVEPETTIRGVRVPMLLTHGTRDAVIPGRELQRLAAAALAPVSVLEIKGAEHSDLGRFPAYREGLLRFLGSLGLQEASGARNGTPSA